MILHVGYEELAALRAAGERLLALQTVAAPGAAPRPELLTGLEELLPRLTGDISIVTFAEQQSLERTLELVVTRLRSRVDQSIIEQHVGAEGTVDAFFEYGRVLKVLDRVRRIGDEMAAIIELITGGAPTPESAVEVTFTD